MDSDNRIAQAKVDEMFTDRWSPRSFTSQPVEQWEIDSMLEAARWAPSCYNEQPWSFAYAVTEKDRARFASALVEQNQVWAAKAPLLMFVVICKAFKITGEPNGFAVFDGGSAWMSLALQARKLGLYAHGMAGFSKEKASQILGLKPETHTIGAAIAVGRLGPKDALPEKLAAVEFPNDRKPLSEMTWNW